jgi:Flp pilus assembly pilin Flp
MKSTLNHVATFVKAENASAATEYAIMLGLIVLAAVGAIGSLGEKMSGIFGYLHASLPV